MLNKRGHIPCVFPHENTSCSRGKSGTLGVHWGLAENDTSFAEGLISFVCVFFSPPLLHLHYLHPSIITTSHSVPLSPHPPFGIMRLDLKCRYNIYCIGEHTEENVPMQTFRQVFQGMTQIHRCLTQKCCCEAAHYKVFAYMCVYVLRALDQQRGKSELTV